MGKVPGVASEYETGPVAVMAGKSVNEERKHANHAFYGPGYPIAHPGVFSSQSEAESWSMEEWLQFDYRAGWGTEEFEELVDSEEIEIEFPEAWEDSGDREDARYIIDENIEKIKKKKKS